MPKYNYWMCSRCGEHLEMEEERYTVSIVRDNEPSRVGTDSTDYICEKCIPAVRESLERLPEQAKG